VHDDGTVFVVTGDIPAMWLRDSAAQVRPLLALRHEAPEVVELVAGVLRLQVELVLLDPHANAFTGPPYRVFERKYEVDSLCAPPWLAWSLWRATGSLDHVDERFVAAATSIVALWRREQAHEPGSYRFRRVGRRRGSLSHGGFGAPFAATGMTWSAFRPSDDRCVYPFNVPQNAFAAVSLERLAELGVLVDESRALAAELRAAIARHGVVDGRYAYEVDGLGHALSLDDANVPSLLSLPYLGFGARDDPVYAATRSFVLSSRNPTWGEGAVVSGVGSEHTRGGWVWPLAIAIEGLTAADDAERERALERVEATATGELLLHEAVDPNDPVRFTRSWFSWADMLYVELVLASAGFAVV
jgi:meiotically up-regulated gene 157 (Mug157) protein